MKKKKQNNKKIYGLIAVIIVLIGIIGYIIFSGQQGIGIFGAAPGEKKIQSSEEAGKTLSDLGNDLQKVSEDLREMEGVLG